MNWLEVSLTVEAELVEPVSEVLARFVTGGVVIESTTVASGPHDAEGHIVGPLRVFGYLPLDQQLEENRQKLEEALWYLGRIQPLPEPQYKPIQQANWAEAWKQHYRPIAIGQKLVIVPAWLENPPGERIPIRIDPGMAFGTGTHPTTQLCLQIIEKTLRVSGLNVIDLGCGTAILAIAALKLGASHALGVDIDADAIQAARRNAENNAVSDRLELGLGSLQEIQAGDFSIRQAPLVLVNILAPVLVRQLDQGLGELLTPGGCLVLSGILAEQAPDVEVAALRNNLQIVERLRMEDWVTICCAKER